jgi:fermentation-respiration switch protein FrsA (DUF1100 family)
MNKWLKAISIGVGVLLVVLFVALALVTRAQAIEVLTLPPEERPALVQRPEDFGLVCEDVTTTNEDGLHLYGWFIPGENGATIMVQHGSPGGRQDGLFEAEFLNRQGYNVLMGSFRAHDESDGELISFGYREVKDMAAWHNFLLGRPEVDPDRIGILGESMGGGTGILYTARNPDIKALVTASAFAMTKETIETFIEFELDPPDWVTPVLANFIVFWAEREGDFQTEDVDTEAVVGQISPRPLLIIQGGNEDKIDPASGQRLYDAANEPKELWFVPEAGHVNFEEFRPEEYERRVVAFFDRYLLAD